MSTALSAVPAIPAVPAATASPQHVQKPASANLNPVPASKVSEADTVHLSTPAQVLAMKQEGASAAQIASSTGLTPAQVDSQLGIAVAADPVTVAKVIAALLQS